MELLADPRIKILLHETFLYRRAVVAIFAVVNVVFLIGAVAWPKGYLASTTVLVSEKNIIQPLMQGTAVPTEVADRARMAREIILGRKVMDQVLATVGWVNGDTTPAERDRIIGKISTRMTISNVGKNLIKIEYKDDVPERALRTTQTLADLFIKESIGAKAAESQAAFEFIDQQTQEYHDKLTRMEDQLKQFRIANIDAAPGAEGDLNTRMNALQTRIEQSMQDLKEAEVKKRSLQKQLSGEAETAAVVTREGQYRAMLADLQSQLDTLRLNYHDTYPDIVRIRHQIDDLKQAIATDKQRRETARPSANAPLDDTIINNPMYQQLKRDLSQTQVTIDQLTARISEAKQQLNSLLERGKRAQGGEATLAELTRDYQVNRDIYQDLLRRRENARVSMNMDKENQGLTFKIQEPATLPTAPSGLRFWHFVVAGLLFGTLIPIGLVYGKMEIDSRVRTPKQIAQDHKLPILVSVPHLWSRTETASARRDLEQAVLIVIGTLGVVGFVTMLRIVRVI